MVLNTQGFPPKQTSTPKLTQIAQARRDYNIDEWGAGYFGIDDRGFVECYPTGKPEQAVTLHDIVTQAKQRGIHPPLIIRFSQIIASQLQRLELAFQGAITEFNYHGRHYGVFPFKVNQRREFIDAVIECGAPYDYGLEVGSKSELIAALSYPLSPRALLVCNGFKDEEFITMSCLAAEMGKNAVLVVEGPDELQILLAKLHQHRVTPQIGIRTRLYSRGSGKWENSSGATSKFGLTIVELLDCLKTLKQEGHVDKVSMLHLHIGSQITEIKKFKTALKEAARIYSKIVRMGFSAVKYLNIGGGVGVDYDGSKTSAQFSANYVLQEFVNDAVYVIGQVCKAEGVATPDIVTESGRIIAAYHSLVVTDIREVQAPSTGLSATLPIDPRKAHKSLIELRYVYDNINYKNYAEYYHDAIEYHEELATLFNLGYIDLDVRGCGEELFQEICRKALYFSASQKRPLEELKSLRQRLISKYLANFSIFQSIPDAWSIGQLFPIMPLSRHQEEPTHEANIVDITCDSDGCLDQFIDCKKIKSVLGLHSPSRDPYYLGFFLVGAYQESLASEHNLFGATHEVEVTVTADGSYEIAKITAGDTITELLESRNYSRKTLVASFLKQVEKLQNNGTLNAERSSAIITALKSCMKSYPYLSN